MLNGIRFWPQFLSFPEEGMEDFKILFLFLILWIKGKKKEKKNPLSEIYASGHNTHFSICKNWTRIRRKVYANFDLIKYRNLTTTNFLLIWKEQ